MGAREPERGERGGRPGRAMAGPTSRGEGEGGAKMGGALLLRCSTLRTAQVSHYKGVALCFALPCVEAIHKGQRRTPRNAENRDHYREHLPAGRVAGRTHQPIGPAMWAALTDLMRGGEGGGELREPGRYIGLAGRYNGHLPRANR